MEINESLNVVVVVSNQLQKRSICLIDELKTLLIMLPQGRECSVEGVSINFHRSSIDLDAGIVPIADGHITSLLKQANEVSEK